jgi:hypothetical protein
LAAERSTLREAKELGEITPGDRELLSVIHL